MKLKTLNILNYKNIREANLSFADKINCFVGLNGQGKTNLLDAIYYLSFTKSFFNVQDSQNITHDADFALIQGEYEDLEPISCGIKRGQKKQFRRGKKDYKRLIDHIGLIPLVIVSPQDAELITDGSDERRRFLDGVISIVCQFLSVEKTPTQGNEPWAYGNGYMLKVVLHVVFCTIHE